MITIRSATRRGVRPRPPPRPRNAMKLTRTRTRRRRSEIPASNVKFFQALASGFRAALRHRAQVKLAIMTAPKHSFACAGYHEARFSRRHLLKVGGLGLLGLSLPKLLEAEETRNA